jgi:hypothetical protein
MHDVDWYNDAERLLLQYLRRLQLGNGVYLVPLSIQGTSIQDVALGIQVRREYLCQA